MGLLVSPACGGGDSERGGRQANLGEPQLAFADSLRVAPGDEGDFDDLPGLDGFDRLSPELRATVTERANLTRCDCGCARHSVSHCLHQREACDVARRMAQAFLDDALAHQFQAPGPDHALTDETGSERLESSGEPSRAGGSNTGVQAAGARPRDQPSQQYADPEGER